MGIVSSLRTQQHIAGDGTDNPAVVGQTPASEAADALSVKNRCVTKSINTIRNSHHNYIFFIPCNYYTSVPSPVIGLIFFGMTMNCMTENLHQYTPQ